MKTGISCARLAVLPCALGAVFPVWAQSDAVPVLKPIVVTSSHYAESAETLPYGVSVITAADIRAAGVDTVSEAISKLLGVPGRLDTSGGNNYTLDLRGFGSTADNNQVVIVDGLRLNEQDLGSTGLGAIPIAAVERIEVMRGSGAVLYGEGATGGVIVVTTKAGKGVERKNAAELYLGAGSYGLRDARATAVLASGGFSLDVAAQDRKSNGHRDNFASQANNLAATGQWSNDWLRVGVRGGHSALQSGLPGSLTAAQYAADPSQAKSLTDYGSVQGDNAGAFVEAALGDWQLGLDATQRTKQYRSLSSGSAYGYNVDASNGNLRARHDGTLGSLGNAFTVGLEQADWTRTITQSTFTPIGTRATSQASAWYVNDDVSFTGSGTRLSLGWRGEDLQKTEASSATRLKDSPNAWSLGLNQALGAQWNAYARTGQSYRLANVDEFSYTSPGVPLQTQTSRDAELGLRWNTAAHHAELRLYRNELSNEIGYDPTAADPYGGTSGANINFAPTRHQGLELETRHALARTLDLRLNAAVREAKFVAGPYSGNDLPLVPGKSAALGLDWRFAEGQALDMGLLWVSEQRADFANQCSIPSYTTVDTRYAYTMKNVELALAVKNLADTKYYTQAFTCTAGVTNGIYPEAGRTLTASLRVAF